MKERLTGAIIVVALLVLLVPELLTGPESKQPANPAGADGAQLRSYTIDLQDDATRRPPPPTAPTTAASDDPVAQATPEADTESSSSIARVGPPVEGPARAAGQPMGSGADSAAAQDSARPAASAPASAATPGNSNATAGAATSGASSKPSAADETPRSAFGPNAVTRTPPPSAKPDTSKADAA